MLYKLSIKNLKKSIKDYCIYFFTLILGVSIFYIFNSLESQTVMMKVSTNTRDIIKLMNNTLSAVSVFVSFILGFLIIYASRFLIKRRKQEFGIYLTLGMSKRKISTILLFETLFIGIISLLSGLLIGTFISQFMSVLVANMFEADLTNFRFIFSTSAAIKTLIYFSIIYILVMIFNIINISKCKLIDLIRSNKTSEKIKLKNPILCTIIFILSCITLGIAYYLVTGGINILKDASMIYIPILMGIIGTYFLFWSLSGLLIKIFLSMKNMYYKGLNSFILRQISSKVNTTVMSMTIISLMLFVTICVLSSALSLKNSYAYNLKTLVPRDLEIEYNTNNNEDKINEILNNSNFDTSTYLKDITEINIYETEELKLTNTLGSYYQKALQNYPLLTYGAKEKIITISDYNKIAKMFNLEKLTLKEDEYILLADYDSFIEIRETALKLNTKINILNKTYYPKYKEHKNGFIYMYPNHANDGVFIVPDSAVNEQILSRKLLIADYNANTKEEKEQIEKNLTEINNDKTKETYYFKLMTKIKMYESSIGLGAMATFIGLYLGIIFLISSAAILALKELSESTDNKERYKVLRRLGTDEHLINKALFKQIGLFFMFPLLIAIIHSIFGIMFCNFILETLGNEKLLISIIMTSIFLIIIYGGYFLITYLYSKNIIKE